MINPAYIMLFLSAFALYKCDDASGRQDNSSPFEYREVYLPELPFDEGHDLYMNNVDRDWGIWGHNLSKVLPKNASQSVYAKSGNSVNSEQFCFSSDALFKYIEDYITDNYGRDKTVRFAILPNDNSIVCLCDRCVENGNKAGDASGAVYSMLERLTERFPEHIFFSSYYRTTSNLPHHKLPDNAGVLISAMSYPLSPVHTAQEDAFEELLLKWSKYTKRIYIWDYMNNFDDYFTPIPVFDVIQRRLSLYARTGVKGVFFNGSGTDYSTFFRIKTHIISALLRDPETDWRPILKELCNELYPVTGEAICKFLTLQEDLLKEKGKALPLYEGVSKASKIYLPAAEFEQFHDELMSLIMQIKDPERAEIRRMTQSMMLTRLELKRINSDTVGCARLLDGLDRLKSQGIVTYSESGANIDSYIKEYRYMLNQAKDTGKKNLLKGVRLQPLTALDEEYNDISILTDGLIGLPSNYHCGLMLSSATPALRIAIPYVKGIKRIRVSLAKNSIYHIAFPLSVSLSSEEREIGKVTPKALSNNLQRAVVEFNIPSDCKGTLVLTIVRNQEERTMALDEIEGF